MQTTVPPRAEEPWGASRQRESVGESCSRIIVVGAGGFGREVLNWFREASDSSAGNVAGFLSADPHILERHTGALPILGDPDSFVPSPDDGLLLAIGIPGVRRRITEALLARGCRFLTLVHPTAIVAPTARIGAGTIVCPQAVISDAAHVGRFAIVNYHASVAHDAELRDFSVLSPYAAIGGGARVAEDVFLGLHASIGPRVAVGARSKVAANSSALHDVPADSLVHGVPGRITPCLG